MTLRRDDAGAIILEGNCPVEDAEPLLQILQAAPTAMLDWSRCNHLHTAVLQVILAARIAPAGPCGDPWIRQWMAPDAPGKRRGSRAHLTGSPIPNPFISLPNARRMTISS